MSTPYEPLPPHEQDPLLTTPPASDLPTKSSRKIQQTRVGYTWVGLVVSALVGIVLLIFILQNLDAAQIDILFWQMNLPIGIAVLLASILGALIMAMVGGARIFQIRKQAKRM
ncbi:DUF1049 domain-containing protein [Antrihabitans sp. YC3-6]|uniref:DUF1049 domain-containing protein n=1 Tax=Antrihabitans stalagmiti TaxID=2799499 RepID=A0A934NVQ0_9NOCA|nr:lipopolysaccharide assembly protein LapA domain-containing protein [Antrihabitans stalagmiti]MBJ8342143.1 DUF1049 domain-containing protein [Antrihabitans stalagmiti]